MKFSLKAGIALAALTGAVAMAGSFSRRSWWHAAGRLDQRRLHGADAADHAQCRGSVLLPRRRRLFVVQEPKLTWPVNNDDITGYYEGNDPTAKFHEISRTSTFITDKVANTQREGSAFGEFGAGCGLGGGDAGRGFRGEVMFGFHGDRTRRACAPSSTHHCGTVPTRS